VSARALLTALGAASAALYGAVYLGRGLHGPPAGFNPRIIAYPALFLAYFAACWVAWRYSERLYGRRALGLMLALAALFRTLVLFGPVADNVDTWRYLWEGRVVLAGMNPYAAPPASARYDGLRRELQRQNDPLYERLRPSWNKVRSVYGPVATGLFTLPHLSPFGRCWSVRLLMTLFDFAAALMLVPLLRALGRPPILALLYAWSPLCLDAFADRAHIDAPVVFLLAAALYLVSTQRPGWAGIALGGALLVKVSPLLLVPAFVRAGRARLATALLGVLVAGALPYALAGPGALSGFRDFGTRWQDNDSAHAVLVWLLGACGGSALASVSRVLVATLAVGYALYRAVTGDPTRPLWLTEACAAVTGASLLLAPIAFPWYATSLLLFVTAAPSLPWLLYTAGTMGWYTALWAADPATWAGQLLGVQARDTQPLRWLSFPPVYALLLAEWLRARGRCAGPRTGSTAPD
jgi:hypothetical protein